MKKEFIDFMLESDVLRFGEFITKSKRESPYFINTGRYFTAERISKLGYFYAKFIDEKIKEGVIPDDIKLFGPAYKGIPIVVATSIALFRDFNRNISYIFNRKEAKDHGEGGSLVGYEPKDDDNVLILEDIITAGTAIRETVPVLYKAANVKIAGIIFSVDRMEKGRKDISARAEIEQEFGIPTFCLVNVKEILDVADIDEKTRASLEKYMDKWCALYETE